MAKAGLAHRDVETLQGVSAPNSRLPGQAFGPDFARQATYGRAIMVMSDAHLRSLGLINAPMRIEQRPTLGQTPSIPRVRHHPTVLIPLGNSLILRLKEAAAPVDDAADRPGLEPQRSANEATAAEQEEISRRRRA